MKSWAWVKEDKSLFKSCREGFLTFAAYLQLIFDLTEPVIVFFMTCDAVHNTQPTPQPQDTRHSHTIQPIPGEILHD